MNSHFRGNFTHFLLILILWHHLEIEELFLLILLIIRKVFLTIIIIQYMYSSKRLKVKEFFLYEF